jgi:hypothetical protein
MKKNQITLTTKESTFHAIKAEFDEKKELRKIVKKKKELQEQLDLMKIQANYLEWNDLRKKSNLSDKQLIEIKDKKSKADKERLAMKRKKLVYQKQKEVIEGNNKNLTTTINEVTNMMLYPQGKLSRDAAESVQFLTPSSDL